MYGLLKLGKGQNAGVKRVAMRFNRNLQTCIATITYTPAHEYEAPVFTG
jgi:hypothetical protein